MYLIPINENIKVNTTNTLALRVTLSMTTRFEKPFLKWSQTIYFIIHFTLEHEFFIIYIYMTLNSCKNSKKKFFRVRRMYVEENSDPHKN